MTRLALILAAVAVSYAADTRRSWASDNGNGTYSNPLFYDEFPDPDMIRVGSDYYLTGTTMHAMPGLPILHSRDLVNWRWIAYAFDRLDLGPDFRLEGGNIYAVYGARTIRIVELRAERGDALLRSLATHRYVVVPKTPGPVSADHPGPAPDRKDGSCLQWKVAK